MILPGLGEAARFSLARSLADKKQAGIAVLFWRWLGSPAPAVFLNSASRPPLQVFLANRFSWVLWGASPKHRAHGYGFCRPAVHVRVFHAGGLDDMWLWEWATFYVFASSSGFRTSAAAWSRFSTFVTDGRCDA